MKANQPIKKLCEYCQQPFFASKITTRYCSLGCNRKAYKEAQRQKIILHTTELTKTTKRHKEICDFSLQEYLTISQVAILTGVSRWTIYRYAINGVIPCKRFSSRKTLIRKSDIENLFENKEHYTIQSPPTTSMETVEWYTLNDITEHYGIKRHRIRKIVNSENIPEIKDGTRTLIAKNKIDAYFKKQGYDSSIKNLAEWYTVADIMKVYSMTEQSVYLYVSRYAIPKKQQDGKRYYSKQHIDKLKNKKP